MQSKHDVYASPKRGFIAQRLPCAECYFNEWSAQQFADMLAEYL